MAFFGVTCFPSPVSMEEHLNQWKLNDWLQHHVYYLIALACYFLENWFVCLQVYHRSCVCQNTVLC